MGMPFCCYPLIVDKKTNMISDTRVLHKFNLVFWSICITLLFIDIIYYMLHKNNWTKLELIYVIEIPLLCLTAINFIIFLRREGVERLINIIESMQTLEELLTNHHHYKKTDRLTNYLITFVGLLFLSVCICFFPSVYFFIFIPDIKIFAIQGILGTPSAYYVMLLISITIFLGDRALILNLIIAKFINVHVINGTCELCTDNTKTNAKILCTKHQIE